MSLDVFGVALRPLVLEPSDHHLLVAEELAAYYPTLAPHYPRLRQQAEADAQARATIVGQGAVRLADIADQLRAQLAKLPNPGRGQEPPVEVPADVEAVTRAAVAVELEGWQRLHPARADGLRLYHDARRRGLPVAFVTDSHLPRDLVARLLRQAGYGPGHLLVSSHEGVTKATGLYLRLIELAGGDPSVVIHIGPDDDLDVAVPASLGLVPHQIVPPAASRPLFPPRATIRPGGMDSIALAIAANDEIDHPGYRAGGPLVAGVASWVAAVAAAERATGLVVVGPRAPARSLARTLDQLGLAGAPVGRPVVVGPDPDPITALRPSPGGAPAGPVLVVDLGLGERARRQALATIDAALNPDGDHRQALVVAHLDPHQPAPREPTPESTSQPAPPEAPEAAEVARRWAGACWSTGPGTWSLTLPGLSPDAGDAALPLLHALMGSAEAERYVADASSWLTEGWARLTPAVLGPAARVVTMPEATEVSVLTALLQLEGDDGPDWPAAQLVLAETAEGPTQEQGRPSPRLGRRLGRRHRNPERAS